jgi:hypothetical protein
MFTVFKEPGSGLIMLLGKWYVLSDSGSAYGAYGFDSVALAVEWWSTSAYLTFELASTDIAVPVWLAIENCWDASWDFANVLKADELKRFWQTSDPLVDLHCGVIADDSMACIGEYAHNIRHAISAEHGIVCGRVRAS